MSISTTLSQALRDHAIPHTVDGDILRLASPSVTFNPEIVEKPARAGSAIVQLNLATTSPKLSDRTLWHSFAGIGPNRAAAENNAAGKFILGAFHVILNTLGDHSCEADGTHWTAWHGASMSWKVCHSPLLVQGADPASVGYSAFLERLEPLYLGYATPGLHWCEVFFASLNGEPSAAEVHLDNELWEDASEALTGWHTDLPPGYRSGRHFFIAQPADPLASGSRPTSAS